MKKKDRSVIRIAGFVIMLSVGIVAVLGILVISTMSEGKEGLAIALLMCAMPIILAVVAHWRPWWGSVIAIGANIPVLVFSTSRLMSQESPGGLASPSIFALSVVFLFGSIMVYASAWKVGSKPDSKEGKGN